MVKVIKLLLLLFGIAGAGYLVVEHAETVRGALARVGWGFALYLAASFVAYALDTWAWRLVFAKGQPHVGFARLFSIRMAGEAVNKVTPLASLGGEPLKAYLLVRCGAGAGEAGASVAVAKNVMTLGQIAFIFTGIGLAFTLAPQKQGPLLALGIFPALILTAMIVTAILDHRLRRRRKSEKDGAAPNKVLVLWGQFADYFWANPSVVLSSFVVFYVGWAAGALELIAAAYLLGFPLSITEAVAYEALLASITMATFFIPANAGSQEGGFAYLAPLLGLPPYGVALAVLRRCRDVVWVLFGLAYLSFTEGRFLVQPQPVAKGSAS
jgi:uncharacterized protein (TIRG00374 family)